MNILHSIGAAIASIGIFIGGLFGYTPETVQAPVQEPAQEELGRAVDAVGGRTYTLAGSGISSSATTITLASLKAPVTGALLTMDNFGQGVNAKAYATLEQGNPQRQEFISFTGVTQNGDGTATLTGVSRGLLPFPPYTASSTYAVAHNGGSSLVISNSPGFYEAIYSYIDNATTSGAVDAAPTIKGLVEIASGLEAASSTPFGTGNTSAYLALTTAISTSTGGTAYTIPVTRLDGKIDGVFCCSGTTTFTSPPTGITRVTTYLASTTYTKPAGLQAIDLEMWGAGGGGESHASLPAGGGGGGEYKFVRIAAGTLSATTTVVIGTGGPAGADGTAGGNTSFGSILAYGGSGAINGNVNTAGWGGFPGGNGSSSLQSTTSSAICSFFGSCPGVFGGTATSSVDYGGGGPMVDNSRVANAGSSINGGGGGGGARSGVTANPGTSLNGGNGGAGAASGNASNGSVPGGGGGGAFNGTGGNGGNGMVRITEYF